MSLCNEEIFIRALLIIQTDERLDEKKDRILTDPKVYRYLASRLSRAIVRAGRYCDTKIHTHEDVERLKALFENAGVNYTKFGIGGDLGVLATTRGKFVFSVN